MDNRYKPLPLTVTNHYMIKKRETCKYCGEKMESKTAKKQFCSEQHRIYYFREMKDKVEVGKALNSPEFQKAKKELVNELIDTGSSVHTVEEKTGIITVVKGEEKERIIEQSKVIETTTGKKISLKIRDKDEMPKGLNQYQQIAWKAEHKNKLK